MPKSATLTWPSLAIRTLPGLMSRWTMPRAWAAASPWATPAPIRATWRGGSVPAPAQDRRQVLAVDELHDDERPARVLAVVVDGDDVRVVERGGGLGLLAETRGEVGVAQVLGTEQLEGDVAAEPGVVGAVDGRHPAAAKELDQAISTAQDLSDLRQVVPLRWCAHRPARLWTLRGIVPHGRLPQNWRPFR